MVSDWIAAYEDYLKTEKQASANTVSSYLRDVRQFAAAMEEQERPLAQVPPMEVEGYIHQLTVLEVPRHGDPLSGLHQILL